MKNLFNANEAEGYSLKGFNHGAPIWWQHVGKDEIYKGFISSIWTCPEGGVQIGIRVKGSQWDCKLCVSNREYLQLRDEGRTTHRESLGSTRIQVLK